MNASGRSDQIMPSDGMITAGWRGILAGLLVLFFGVALNMASVRADESGEGDASRMEVAPLRSLIAQVREVYPGHILEVELEREAGDLWIYEVKLLTDRGRVLKLDYDAVSLELLKLKGRPDS